MTEIEQQMGKPPQSPFTKATKASAWVKLFVYGVSGTGKTLAGLWLPKPIAVIDNESGTSHYWKKDFDVSRPKTLIETKNLIWYLIKDKYYKTIMLDSITTYYKDLQTHWSDIFIERNPDSKQNKEEFYDFGPREWNIINSEYIRMIKHLLNTKKNVVVTARETDQLKRIAGQFVNVGIKPEAGKGTKYYFDTVLHLTKEDNKYYANPEKDRTGRLPKTKFEMDLGVWPSPLITTYKKEKTEVTNNEGKLG